MSTKHVRVGKGFEQTNQGRESFSNLQHGSIRASMEAFDPRFRISKRCIGSSFLVRSRTCFPIHLIPFFIFKKKRIRWFPKLRSHDETKRKGSLSVTHPFLFGFPVSDPSRFVKTMDGILGTSNRVELVSHRHTFHGRDGS